MLTSIQIAAIVMLLQAFGASPSVVAIVQKEITPPIATVATNQTATTFPVTVAPIAPQAPPANTSQAPSMSGFVSVSQLSADPLAYLGNTESVTGMESGFLPQGGRGGSTNYIQLENPFDPSQPYIEAEIDSGSLYEATVNALQDPTSPILAFVKIFGTVAASQPFTHQNVFGNSTTVWIPVVDVSRIFQCQHGSMNTTIVDTDFGSNFTCTSWTEIQPGISNNAETIQDQSQEPSTPAKADQTITFNPLPDVTYGIADFAINAQASSGLGVSFTAQGNCTVSAGLGTAQVYPTGVGSCTITAHQAGDADYTAAPDVSWTFAIDQAAPTLSSDATLSALTYNGTAVAGFNGSTYTYVVDLPTGTTAVPTLSAIADSESAAVVVTQASAVPGRATVVVTAANGVAHESYTVYFLVTGSGLCDFNGDVFSCATNPWMTINPISLPNGTVGVSYSEPLTLSDPLTSSQTIRWNIIGGHMPPGIGIAFSPNYALECSGTYCYFTTPPSGVSATAPGSFFGTPTNAGTYSFTLQAIDGVNAGILPTFTITVASSTSSQ